MRILFDHGVPRGFGLSFKGHKVNEAKTLGWDTLSNGELLSAAENSGFDVLLTTDKNLPHQQNLASRKIAVVVQSSARWRLIEPMSRQIVATVSAAEPGTHSIVEIRKA